MKLYTDLNQSFINTRGVTIRFNNDRMRIMIHGWRYNTRIIWAHFE